MTCSTHHRNAGCPSRMASVSFLPQLNSRLQQNDLINEVSRRPGPLQEDELSEALVAQRLRRNSAADHLVESVATAWTPIAEKSAARALYVDTQKRLCVQKVETAQLSSTMPITTYVMKSSTPTTRTTRKTARMSIPSVRPALSIIHQQNPAGTAGTSEGGSEDGSKKGSKGTAKMSKTTLETIGTRSSARKTTTTASTLTTTPPETPKIPRPQRTSKVSPMAAAAPAAADIPTSAKIFTAKVVVETVPPTMVIASKIKRSSESLTSSVSTPLTLSDVRTPPSGTTTTTKTTMLRPRKARRSTTITSSQQRRMSQERAADVASSRRTKADNSNKQQQQQSVPQKPPAGRQKRQRSSRQAPPAKQATQGRPAPGIIRVRRTETASRQGEEDRGGNGTTRAIRSSPAF